VAKKIEVQIVGDASSLQRALGQATSGTSKFGSALGTLAKTGALAAGAAGIGAVAVTLRQGIAEYTEAAKVAAQTNAVIKSTGQIANVTAKDVDRLATSLMKKTGVDDEAIATGENMILTFKNIRNEAGAGNDIFNQTTKAVLDMDTAMTQGNVTAESMAKTSIRVGKALNDPIKGITALSRVGVTFTEGQKEQIKAMVESGDVMGAQKLILKELTSEFGGSAEAIGKTMPKQLNILKESFNNFAGDLVAKAIPSVQRFVDFLNTRLIPAEGFTATLKVAWEGLSEVAVDLWGQLETAVMGETKMIRIPMEKRVEFVEVQGLAAKLKESLRAQFAAIDWSDLLITVGVGIVKGIAQLQQWIWTSLFSAWKGAWGLILGTVRTEAGQLVSAIIEGGSSLASRFRNMIQTAMISGVAAITGAIGSAYSAAMNLGSRIVVGVSTGIADLVGKVRDKLNDIRGAITSTASAAVGWAAGIGRAIVDGIVSGASGLGSRLAGKLIGEAQAALSRVKGFLHIGSPSRMWAEEVGIPIAEGITLGAAHQLSSTLAPNLSKVIKTAMDSTLLGSAAAAGGTGVGVSLKGGIDEFLEDKLPDNLAQVLGLAFDQASVAFTPGAIVNPDVLLPALRPETFGPGRAILSDVSTPTVVVNNYAPINSQEQLDSMVQAAAARLRNGGRLPI
jgi:hypothetical protein